MSLTNDISKLMSHKNYTLACNGQTEVADCMKAKGLSAASHTKYKTALAALHISTLKELSEHDGRKIFFVTKAEHIPDILSKLQASVEAQDSSLTVPSEVKMLEDVAVELILMLQPVGLDSDGNIGEAGKSRIRTLIDTYTANGGQYDRQYGVNGRSIIILHNEFLDCVYDSSRPFQLKVCPLKSFSRVNSQTSEFDAGNAMLVRQYCRRYVQAITIASGIVLNSDVLQRFVRDRTLDTAVATTDAAGNAIAISDRSYFLGTPKGFETMMSNFLENSELDGPSLQAAFERLLEETSNRMSRDFRLLNSAGRQAMDYCTGLNLLTQLLGPDVPVAGAAADASRALVVLKPEPEPKTKICPAYQTDTCVPQGKCPAGLIHKCANCLMGGHPQMRCPKLGLTVKKFDRGRRPFDRDRFARDRDRDREGDRRDRDRDRDRDDTRRYYDRRG